MEIKDMEGKPFGQKRVCSPAGFRSSRGFTLVELLVVIGIIALLISVLLPAQQGPCAGNTVVCLSNLRSIGQALTIYLSENNGFLPGSGNTTGRGLWKLNAVGTCVQATGVSITSIPGNVIQTEDWIGPLAAEMGLSLPQGNGLARFVAYCNLPQFQCPEYAQARLDAVFHRRHIPRGANGVQLL